MGSQSVTSDGHTAFSVTEKGMWLDPSKWYSSYIETSSYYMGLHELIVPRNRFGLRADDLQEGIKLLLLFNLQSPGMCIIPSTVQTSASNSVVFLTKYCVSFLD